MKKHLDKILLALVPIALYFKALYYGFIWDDFCCLVNNATVQKGANFFQLWTFNKINPDLWPASYSFLWLVNQFADNSSVIFHAVNLLLFTSSVLLLFKLLNALNFKNSFLLAMAYAVHPMNVSLAVWIFQIKTNLAIVFALLACLFFKKFLDKNSIQFNSIQ